MADKNIYEDPSRTPKPSEKWPNPWTATKKPEGVLTPERENFVYELVKKLGTINRNAQKQMEKSRKSE